MFEEQKWGQCSSVGSQGESGKMLEFYSENNGKTWNNFEQRSSILFGFLKDQSACAFRTLERNKREGLQTSEDIV